jgi:hypothetical protein
MTTVDPKIQVAPRAVGSRNFFIAAGILLVAAVGLNFTVAHLQLYFKKEPVPMRMSFKEALPQVIETTEEVSDSREGDKTQTHHWVQVCRDDNLEPDLLAALATDEFLFCTYIDADAFGMTPAEVISRFKGPGGTVMPLEMQRKVLGDEFIGSSKRRPEAVIQFALTYYTGKADTVAHIPERCYVGGGFDPVDPSDVRWTLPGSSRPLEVRSITFENQSRADTYRRNVSYFFNVNGHYTQDSLAVRADLQNLFARHGYYAKVEMMSIAVDRARSDADMKLFLAGALPCIEKALPDWAQYEGRK